MKCVDKFSGIYHKEPSDVAFCPYRICPLGAHIDHQLGQITGFVIDKGIRIAYGPKQNGVIELNSLQFDKRAQFHIMQIPKERQFDWADYLRGAALALSKKYTLEVGLCGVIDGDLPIGGLSSSAAVIIAFLTALCRVNNISLNQKELIDIALSAENDYVGVSCGRLDQSCEVYSKKDHLLYLDIKNDTYELIPQSASMKSYKIAVLFSGLERNLAGSKYNMRVDEVKSAAYALMAYAGVEYGKFNETFLRDVPYDFFEKYGNLLPDNWKKRALHYYTEFDRVQRGVQAWKNGDIEQFGKICFESGHSSIYNWETGSPELKKLYEIMINTDGIYGGRFSGAGFRGCCIAFVDPNFEETALKAVYENYSSAFPQLATKYSAHICDTADGVLI